MYGQVTPSPLLDPPLPCQGPHRYVSEGNYYVGLDRDNLLRELLEAFGDDGEDVAISELDMNGGDVFLFHSHPRPQIVVGRAVIHYVRDEALRAHDLSLMKHPVQFLPRTSYEGLAYSVLILSPGLTDEHDTGGDGAYAVVGH